MDEYKPLPDAHVPRMVRNATGSRAGNSAASDSGTKKPASDQGLTYTRAHFNLNVSAFCGIGGALRDCVGGVWGRLRGCKGVLGDVEGVQTWLGLS